MQFFDLSAVEKHWRKQKNKWRNGTLIKTLLAMVFILKEIYGMDILDNLGSINLDQTMLLYLK